MPTSISREKLPFHAGGGVPLDWDRLFTKCFLDALAPLDFKLSVRDAVIYVLAEFGRKGGTPPPS